MRSNKLITEFMDLPIKENIPYDDDWRWLMQAVNKCLSTPVKEEGGYFQLKEALSTAKKDVIYKSVVQFITDKK
tara:strand:- start:291 stop:512 length:222 start_codon:yes stop_codon:yes gene_type:complete